MSKVKEPVELHAAYCWTCEECGRDNFVRAVTADLMPDEYLNLLRDCGALEPDETLEDIAYGTGVTFQSRPDFVTCQCGETFPAVDHGQDSEGAD